MAFDAFNQLSGIDLREKGLEEFPIDSLLNFIKHNETNFPNNSEGVKALLFAKIHEASNQRDINQINLASALLDEVTSEFSVEDLVNKIYELKSKNLSDFLFIKNSKVLIDKLNLEVRIYNLLKRGEIVTMGDLYELIEEIDLYGKIIRRLPNFGPKAISDVKVRLLEYKGALANSQKAEALLNPEIVDLPINALKLNFNTRTQVAFNTNSIYAIRDLYYLSVEELKYRYHFGEVGIRRLQEKLTSLGLPPIPEYMPLLFKSETPEEQ